MKLALSTFPEASTRTLIRILMVPLIVFCADLETTGETCCRTPPGLALAAGAALCHRGRCYRGSGSGSLALTAHFCRRGFGCIRRRRLRLWRGALDLRRCNGFRRDRGVRGNRTGWLRLGGAEKLGADEQGRCNQDHSRDKKNIAPLRGPSGYPDRRRLRRIRWCGLQPCSNIRHHAAALGIEAQTAVSDSHEGRRHRLR